jgi:hypothetical protein
MVAYTRAKELGIIWVGNELELKKH